MLSAWVCLIYALKKYPNNIENKISKNKWAPKNKIGSSSLYLKILGMEKSFMLWSLSGWALYNHSGQLLQAGKPRVSHSV